MLSYREKLYVNYSSNRIGKLSPETVGGFKPREPLFKKLIEEHLPDSKKARILEIGCGHGTLQYFIKQAGYTNSVGVDASEEQVDEAHRLGINNVVFANLVPYLEQMEDRSIDVLIAFDVLEHFNKDELSELADEFHRILKSTGKIICHVPNGESPFANRINYGDFTHETAFTWQSIAQLFLASGFSQVESYEDKPICHGLKSVARYILWEYFIRNLYRFAILVETGECDRKAVFSQNMLSVIKK